MAAILACLGVDAMVRSAPDAASQTAAEPPTAPAVAHRRQILILNSYDPIYGWTANVVRGARSVFDKLDGVELSIEFMDTKKILTAEYAGLLARVYARKYGSMHFDLILSSDDDALNFLKIYRDRLFPGVPVVFCGVNSFRDERIAGFSNVTGVNEDTDFDKSFEWVARLRPSTKQLVFIVDQSATSAGAMRQINEVAPRWRERFQIRYISDVTIAELEAKLRALPRDAVVFWEMFMRDRNNTPLSMAESHRRVVAASPVPVLGFTDVSVALGAAGGYVVSGFSQGETAAAMGARILAGTPADRIPVVRHSPNVYMLDYPAFTRWNLDTEHAPAGAVVQNRPFSFYQRYRGYVWAVFGGMGVESLLILVLIVAIRRMTRKSRARLRESEERYRSIVEDGHELICRFDAAGKVLFANGALARFVNESAEAVLGRPFWSLLTTGPEGANGSIASEIKALTPEHPVVTGAEACLVGGGQERWVLWTYRGLFGSDRKLAEVQAVGHDITGRRAAEQAVRAALLKVEQGNVELGNANRSLQDVLDSMKEGLLVCDRQGVLGPIRSRAAMDWFGTPGPDMRVWDLLFDGPSPEKLRFQLAFEQIADDVLPFELSVDQLSRTFRRGETTYGVGCQQVMRGGMFVELVFTIVDVTRELEQDLVQQLNREQPAIVANLLRDREGFQEFVVATQQMLARLNVVTERDELRRLLHTLKGNTAIYGFDSFAAHCHRLEDAMLLDQGEPTPASLEALGREWHAMLGNFKVFLTDDAPATVRLSRVEYQDLLQRLERRDDQLQLLHMARRWAQPPMSQVLGIHARTVRQLAARLRKEIEPQILDHGLRMPFEEMRSFLGMLVHVVRNACDHGIESPAERERAGKSRVGRISIESRLEDADFVIAVEDDGRGVDWDAVRVRARLRSLPASDSDDLAEALFVDGLTTRDVATDVSGRGIGLGAVRQACRQLGGTVRITSQAGQGTRIEFRFVMPLIMAAAVSGHAAQLA